MGYYTNYDLSELTDAQVEDVNKASGYSFTNSYTSERVKWYLWQDHLKEISLKYPEQVLSISGEGEESGDIWKAYAKNGKLQICQAQIIFEEYDESKLS